MINHGFGVSNFKINPHVVLVLTIYVLLCWCWRQGSQHVHLEFWGLNVHIFSEFQHVLASLQPLRTAMVVKVTAGGCIKKLFFFSATSKYKATFVLQSYYLREACIPCLEIRLGIEQLSIKMCLSVHLGVHSCGHIYIYIDIYYYI